MIFPFLGTSPKVTIQETSKLFDEQTFYQQFLKDIALAKTEVIIESPFITSKRMKMLFPQLKNLVKRKISILILTRDPKEHSQILAEQAEDAIHYCEFVGIQIVICPGGHYRKLAIIDREILWEGSLNILSQGSSREIMRRTYGERSAKDMFSFLHLDLITDCSIL